MQASKIHFGSCVVAVGDVSFSRLHDDLLGIDPRAGFCYSMNGSARRIWELIPEPILVSALCERLSLEFGVDGEVCHKDVVEFLGTLEQAGLVRVAS